MKNPEDIQCPVCGYYCLGKGGIGCIDKPSMNGLTQKIPPTCFECGKPMKNAVDGVTGKVSEYLWHCSCYPNRILSIG